MDIESIKKHLNKLSEFPEYGTSEYSKCFQQFEFIEFLKNTSSEEVPIYIASSNIESGAYLYSVFLPISEFSQDYIEKLMKWPITPSTVKWSYDSYRDSKDEKEKLIISPPFASPICDALNNAIPIFFLRNFSGKITNQNYVELNQEIAQIYDLHYVDETSSYQNLNEEGDFDDKVNISITKEFSIVTMAKEIIDSYSYLTNTNLIRLFDRTMYLQLIEDHRSEDKILDTKNYIYANRGIIYDNKKNPVHSWIRGFQLISKSKTDEDIFHSLSGYPKEKKEYESFIANDWKNQEIKEICCSHEILSNYYETSEKPYEISPVFFKPDVLLKYKQDYEKYTVTERQIHCRGAWGLQTFDTNESGQVFTYLKYLAYLPYSEQQYWKLYNEPPKQQIRYDLGLYEKLGISRGAFITDFKGQFDNTNRPLASLRSNLKKLNQKFPELWTIDDIKNFDKVNYVFTKSHDEWKDEILNLCILVLEPFKYNYLKGIASNMGCFKEDLRPIRLLEEILKSRNFTEELITEITSPLHELNFLRVKFSAHLSGKEAKEIRKKIISKHHTLIEHYRYLAGQLDNSIKLLINHF